MKASVFILILFNLPCVYSQDYPRKEIDLSRIADELYGIQDLDLNYEDLYENLVQILSSPINLNKATLEDLRFIKILTETQIKNFLNYRMENGILFSIYELQSIPGFDLQTIMTLAPFVKVADPSDALDASILKRIRTQSNRYLIIRNERTLESRKGYTSEAQTATRYQGSPDRLYMRLRVNKPGDFSFGFTAEKDAGEMVRWNPGIRYYGADYLSFHASVQNKGFLKNLVIGDFQVQFGQGLMLGGIFGTGKGGETITTVRRSNIGILPYTSVYEAGYLRGAGTTLEVRRNFYLTAFYSSAKRDGTVALDTLEDPFITSMQTTGLHRNENELANRKTTSDTNWGVVLQYKINQLDAGVMFNRLKYNRPFLRDQNVYNQFSFTGIENENIGFFLNYTFQNFSFFNEGARTINGGGAYTGGVLLSLTPKFDISLLYRNFSRDFQSFYSNAFGENSTTKNETGIYWGWKYRFNRIFTISGYIDLFEFPWLRYRAYSPSHGHEWLFRFNYQPSRHSTFFIQIREELKDRNVSDGNTNLYQTATGKKMNYWVSYAYGGRQKLSLKTRVQFSTYGFNNKITKGFAAMQDIRIDLGKIKLSGRYAVFETDDYDNRQYAYEYDALYNYSMPAYYGIGVRKVGMVEYKINQHLSLWLRWAYTRYPYLNEIGSGNDAIAGNIKNDVKFQVRITF